MTRFIRTKKKKRKQITCHCKRIVWATGSVCDFPHRAGSSPLCAHDKYGHYRSSDDLPGIAGEVDFPF